MNRFFFFRQYFLPAAFFSFVINGLLLAPSLYMLQVYDRAISSRSIETLGFMTVLLLAALVLMGCLESVRSRILIQANNALDAALGKELLSAMVRRAGTPEPNPYAYALRDLSTLKAFLGGSGVFVFFDAPFLPLYMILLYMMDPLLFWIGIGGAAIMLILTIINEQATRAPLQEAGIASRNASHYVEVALENAETVNAMGMVPGIAGRWGALNREVLARQTAASRRAGLISGFTRFFRQALQSLMLGAGAFLVITQNLSSGVMIAATITFGRAISPIESAIASWKSLVEARAAYARLQEFLRSQPPEGDHMALPPPRGALALENVALGIPKTNRILLRGVTVTLAAGESLGIIGPSASGKSCLARVLTGIWRPSSGVVRLDGADLSTWAREEVGPHIGYLPQEVALFPGTIAQNIARLGEPDPQLVVAAARKAGVHEIILALPDGYDAMLGDGGLVLSGGQKQRIGLARAMYGSPRLLVLDEPDANLDADGEAALIQTLLALKGEGVTAITITHKMSLLASVSKLLLLKQGAMVVFGPRDAILAQVSRPPASVQAIAPAATTTATAPTGRKAASV